MYSSSQVAVLVVVFLDQVSVLLKVYVPNHIWNLPVLCPAQFWGLLVFLLVLCVPGVSVLFMLEVSIGGSILVRLGVCWDCLGWASLGSAGLL